MARKKKPDKNQETEKRAYSTEEKRVGELALELAIQGHLSAITTPLGRFIPQIIAGERPAIEDVLATMTVTKVGEKTLLEYVNIIKGNSAALNDPTKGS